MTAQRLYACMGGFCRLRENCNLYHLQSLARLAPIERLCKPGQSDKFHPRDFNFPAIPIQEFVQ